MCPPRGRDAVHPPSLPSRDRPPDFGFPGAAAHGRSKVGAGGPALGEGWPGTRGGRSATGPRGSVYDGRPARRAASRVTAPPRVG